MSDIQTTFDEACTRARQARYLESTMALLEWDQQTKLPTEGGTYRAEQITFLAGEIHRHKTAPEFGELISELAESDLAADKHSDAGATIAGLKRDFDRKSKLPQDLVENLARECSLGQQVWIKARAADDFSVFAPNLKTIFKLKREEADAIGFEDQPYDALLDEYEPGAKTAEVARVLDELKDDLVPLVESIAGSKKKPDTDILRRNYPTASQEKFSKHASSKIGFDYNRGRLDITHHPFCTGLGPDDVRITTRYDESFFNSAFFGTLHEAGHGIYEQGLRGEHYGLAPGDYCSLGIHESQSRMWENLVGRSAPFWNHFYGAAQTEFPAALGDVSQENFFAAVNDVRPSLIRVEADELTYNLHIIIRFQLEQQVLNGEIEIDDLPSAWNEKYQNYLGIQPASDANGVLQDVHWSAGLVGYFPTYSLGNIYASQFFNAATDELGDLRPMFAKGEFLPLKEWLNKTVHSRGKCYLATELGQLVTGNGLDHKPLIKHLRDKMAPIYGL